MAKDRFGFNTDTPRAAILAANQAIEDANARKEEFWKNYKRGNAYMWGRLKGESGLLSGIKDIWKHGNQFNKYEKDKGFKEFVGASTTENKLKVINKHFGNKIPFEFGDYTIEEWDEHFKRQNAVLE